MNSYLDPYYTFPPQREVLEEGVRIATRARMEDSSTLFVVGSYQIGKERFAKALAQALQSRIYINDRKKRLPCVLHLRFVLIKSHSFIARPDYSLTLIEFNSFLFLNRLMECLDDDELNQLLSSDPVDSKTFVHMTGMDSLDYKVCSTECLFNNGDRCQSVNCLRQGTKASIMKA